MLPKLVANLRRLLRSYCGSNGTWHNFPIFYSYSYLWNFHPRYECCSEHLQTLFRLLISLYTAQWAQQIIIMCGFSSLPLDPSSWRLLQIGFSRYFGKGNTRADKIEIRRPENSFMEGTNLCSMDLKSIFEAEMCVCQTQKEAQNFVIHSVHNTCVRNSIN